MRSVLFLALASTAFAADACYPTAVQGSYGFLLWGTTTVSGAAKPIASVGRLVFDGKGGISGTSSVMFDVFLLGNPTTGTYQTHTDCSITWKLQDTSGNWQHFSGKFSFDGTHITFTQADPTGPHNGAMVKTPDACAAQTVHGKYRYRLSGAETAEGSIDGAQLSVDDDCFVSFPLGDSQFRGIVVDAGNQVLGIRSNPGAPATIRMQRTAP